jgi:DNA-binding CsgD family transcriptional regulator
MDTSAGPHLQLDLDDPRPLRELRLHLIDHGTAVEVRSGGYTITAYPKDDLGLRNLAIIALTESKVSGIRVAELFGLSQVQVSRIRSDYRKHGSAGLARKLGRPAALDDHQIRQARAWAGEGIRPGEIARRLKVSRPLIVALLQRHGKLYPQPRLDTEAARTDDTQTDNETEAARTEEAEAGRCGGGYVFDPITSGTFGSRYAGAMLTHAFTNAIGAEAILASVCAGTGADADLDLAVLNATRIGFTLGALSIESTKHLIGAQAGPVIGLTKLPSLRTWRTRLGAIGDTVDALALNRDLVTAMLDHQPPPRGVVFADDHLAEYTGHQPVGWGRNPRRGKSTKGHDDTYVCDLNGRALVFATGEPSGLSLTLPGVLAQLTTTLPSGTSGNSSDGSSTSGGSTSGGGGAGGVSGGRPVVVFDRGASYPKTLTTVYQAGYDLICFRRAPLAATTGLPVLATIRQHGRDKTIAYTDEQVELAGFAHPLRQITLFEHGVAVAQLLSTDLAACPGLLLALLRARWIIENFLKYNAANYGIDTLADYLADHVEDTRAVDNPAYQTAKKTETTAKTALAAAKTALAELLADPAVPATDKNTTLIPQAQQQIHQAQQTLTAATAAKKALPATIARNQLHPGARRALLHPQRRCLQLALRLLAANAENHLADALNTYLHDDDEYRAITRETIIRGLGGTITYTPTTITVTLERPNRPHVTTALAQLLHDINQTPPTIPGDHRPITYHLETH